ncbi:hypothetical protein IFT86_22595 [Pseudomonas syringae]|nr:hypothetical protein [Pseudomonas syringae]
MLESRFYLVPNTDEDDERRVLDLGDQYNLSPCLEAADFADVLCVQKRQQPNSSLEDYAIALEHYAQQDAFLEVPGGDDLKAAEPGLARELYAEYDLFLAECAPDRLGVAAREVSAVLEINIATALQRWSGRAHDRRSVHADQGAFFCAFGSAAGSDPSLVSVAVRWLQDFRTSGE